MSGIGLTDYVYVLSNAGPITLNASGQGGHQTYATTGARDAIVGTAFAYAGMFAYVIADQKIYQLENDLTTWTEKGFLPYVVVGTPSSGQVITFNGTNFIYTTPAAPTGGSQFSVADGASLTALNSSTFVNGTPVNVECFDEQFFLNTLDTTTPVDGVTVIAASTGARYFRAGIGAYRWTLQSAWEIDFVSGSDEASGAPGFPIKTRAEMSRRQGKRPTKQNTVVTYTTDHADPITLDTVVGSGFRLREYGLATSVLTGTITGFSNAVPGMNLHDAFADTLVASWTPYLGKRVTLTSGANVGAFAWIGYDLQAGNIVTSPWRKYTANGGADATDRPPTVGDTYRVDDLTHVNYTSIAILADETDTTGNSSVQTFDLDWRAPSLTLCGVSPNGGFRVIACKITTIPFVSTYLQTVCSGYVNGCVMYNRGSGIEIFCGLLSGFYGLNISPNCVAYLYGIPLFNASASIYVQASSYLEVNGLAVLRTTAGFLGASGSHITAEAGSIVRFQQKYAGAADTFYGSVATRRAITDRGATITYKTGSAQTAVGTLAGATVEFGTNDSGLNADDTTGLYTTPTVMTWVNITAAAGGLHSIQTNSHIYQVP